MRLENPARPTACNVKNDDRRHFAPETGIGNDDGTPIGTDLQVLQEGPCWRYGSVQRQIKQYFISVELNTNNSRRPYAMLAMVDGP